MAPLLLERDFTRYFDHPTISNTVHLYVNDASYTCSGILLAQQSPVFEKLVLDGNETILLDQFFFPGTEKVIKECLLFLYGKSVGINAGNLEVVVKFAVFYQIEPLFEACVTWMRNNMKAKNIFLFDKMRQSLEGEKRSRVFDICYELINKPNAANAIATKIQEKLTAEEDIDKEFFLKFITIAPKSSSDLLISWVKISDENKMSILNHSEELSLRAILPDISDFTKFISALSEGSTSVEVMKQVLDIQQQYVQMALNTPASSAASSSSAASASSAVGTPVDNQSETQSEIGSVCNSDSDTEVVDLRGDKAKGKRVRGVRNKGNKQQAEGSKPQPVFKPSKAPEQGKPQAVFKPNNPGESSDLKPQPVSKPSAPQEISKTSTQESSYGVPNAHQIFVGSLPDNTNCHELGKVFFSYGKVVHAKVTGLNFGFVGFENNDAVQKIHNLVKNGVEFWYNQTKLDVRETRNNPAQAGRGGGRGGLRGRGRGGGSRGRARGSQRGHV